MEILIKQNIYIKDDKNFSWFPKKLRNLIIKKYHSQGFIYLKKGFSTNEITDVVKWLDGITVETFSQSHADKMMFDFFNNKYSEYKGKINIF